jgi:hypothetical protein
MVGSKDNMSNWKTEQIQYFKRYLNNFDKGSKQYRVIERGIAELEKSGL